MASTRNIHFLITFILCLLITGCYEVSFEGKSLIQNGRVDILQLETKDGNTIVSDKPLVPSFRTDNEGHFQFALPQALISKAFIRVQSQTASSIKCQLAEGCYFGIHKQRQDYGKNVQISSGLILSSILPAYKQTGRNTVKVDITNHLIAEHALKQAQGLTLYNIAKSHELIKNAFHLEPYLDLHQFTEPVIPNKQDWITQGLLYLSGLPEWLSLQALIINLNQQLQSHNEILMSNQGIMPAVALDQLFGAISHQALLASEINPLYKSNLMTISNYFKQEQLEALNQTELLSSPIEINRQPTDTECFINQPCEVNIMATNHWPMTYQWFKNGLAINNSNSPTFRIAKSQLSHSGSYRVVISNRFGSIISQTATVKIEAKPADPVTKAPQQDKITETLSNVRLEWDIPTRRENYGFLPVHEIKGYKIRYGLTPYSLDAEVTINGANISHYELNNLPPKRYYFVIATVDSKNRQGKFSAPIQIDLSI